MTGSAVRKMPVKDNLYLKRGLITQSLSSVFVLLIIRHGMPGEDLQRYLRVKEWNDGYLMLGYQGTAKEQYEDYIDMPYILENLYMDL